MKLERGAWRRCRERRYRDQLAFQTLNLELGHDRALHDIILKHLDQIVFILYHDLFGQRVYWRLMKLEVVWHAMCPPLLIVLS